MLFEKRGHTRAIALTGNHQISSVDARVKRETAWSLVNLRRMDAYIGVAADHAASFRSSIKERSADKVHSRQAEYLQREASGPRVTCFRVVLPLLVLSGWWVPCRAATQLHRSGNEIQVAVDGRPFTTYYFDPVVAKPYLMPLRTASGSVITRTFPTRNDVSAGNPKDPSFEPHQRPLYFGHGDLDGLDFWGEEAFSRYYDDHAHQAYGRVVLKALDERGPNGGVPEIRARFTLNTPDGRVIGEESQSFQFGGDASTRVIDCEFVLSATAGPLDIGDTKEGTFAIRLAPELSAPLVHMVNSAGAEGEKGIWGKPADWVDYSGHIAGKRVDVVVFDSPISFRHPTTWHARAYGLFAANPFGKREFTRDPNNDGSWAVPEGKSVRFRYRVLIHEGTFDVRQISEAYRKYASTEADSVGVR